ncbi:MAG: hypothetical protein ACYDH9_02340 [Limisphaerales bacterium]
MTDTVKPPAPAWQPLTAGGVAAFAHASARRLLLAELGVAVIVSAGIVWFLATAWFPVITDAIEQLPDRGAIRQGRLDWSGASPVALAGNGFLSIVLDLDATGGLGPASDVQGAFGKTGLTLCSVFGCLTVGYPVRWTISFSRAELGPWWGAWRPVILAAAGLLISLGLLLGWSLLALLYAAPVRLVAFFLDRDLGRGGAWRLASAALMPGALLLAAAVVLYGRHRLDLVGLIVLCGLHLVVGWMYLVLAPVRLPRQAMAAGESRDPFAVPAPGANSGSTPEKEA